MTFKHSLGAAVVLVTSSNAVLQDMQDEQDEREAASAPEPGQDGLIMGRLVRGIVEEGEVIGRSEYLNGHPSSYLVRYLAGDGRQTENWFTADALTTRDEIAACFGRTGGSEDAVGVDASSFDQGVAFETATH